MLRKTCAFLVFFLIVPLPSRTQVQTNALLRVFLLKVGDFTGSAFTVERGGHQYLVTAKHMVDSLPQKAAKIEIYGSNGWDKLTVDILNCKNPEVDIAVLRLDKEISVTFDLEPTSVGVYFGQDAYMLGYPFGLHPLSMGDKPMPFIKRVTISSVDSSKKDAIVWYLDGFNNPGFSGGPVVFWDRKTPNKMNVAAVISGYKNDTAKALVNGQQVDTNILVNSGIVIAYDIAHALEAIDSALPK